MHILLVYMGYTIEQRENFERKMREVFSGQWKHFPRFLRSQKAEILHNRSWRCLFKWFCGYSSRNVTQRSSTLFPNTMEMQIRSTSSLKHSQGPWMKFIKFRRNQERRPPTCEELMNFTSNIAELCFVEEFDIQINYPSASARLGDADFQNLSKIKLSVAHVCFFKRLATF